MMPMKRKHFRNTVADEQRLALIQQRYGCRSQAEAVRAAIRIAALAPLREMARKSPRPLYGLWRESKLAHLDFAAIEKALAESGDHA